jgi:5-methylcytosine-specific restriction protein A
MLSREESLRRMRAAADKARPSMAERGYDKDWHKLRARILSAKPLCSCGCGRLAEVIDHIQPIRTHPHLRLAVSNLRPMAKVCHDQHTARTQGFGRGQR